MRTWPLSSEWFNKVQSPKRFVPSNESSTNWPTPLWLFTLIALRNCEFSTTSPPPHASFLLSPSFQGHVLESKRLLPEVDDVPPQPWSLTPVVYRCQPSPRSDRCHQPLMGLRLAHSKLRSGDVGGLWHLSRYEVAEEAARHLLHFPSKFISTVTCDEACTAGYEGTLRCSGNGLCDYLSALPPPPSSYFIFLQFTSEVSFTAACCF